MLFINVLHTHLLENDGISIRFLLSLLLFYSRLNNNLGHDHILLSVKTSFLVNGNLTIVISEVRELDRLEVVGLLAREFLRLILKHV